MGCSNGDFVKNLSSRQSLVGDCEALVAFRNSLMLQHVISDLPEFRFDPNWGDGDISYWERIEIQDGRVTSIDLRTQVESLSGQIPPEIGQMDALRKLDMRGNWAIEGHIPPEIGNLAQLEELNLSSTGISGEIPPEIGNLAKLKSLVLGDTLLSGEIPPEIGNLTELEGLFILESDITGEIPAEIGNLTKLRTLSLEDNKLTGANTPRDRQPHKPGMAGTLQRPRIRRR